MSISIIEATPADVPVIFGFIAELAEYEKMSDQLVGTSELLHRYLFEEIRCHALVARRDEVPVGYALYFYNFSTFLVRPGLHLEDIYVQIEHRNAGIGRAILKHLAQIALQNDCGRIEWSVLDWNAPSIAFYKLLGAQPMDGWTTMRVTGDAIEKLAK